MTQTTQTPVEPPTERKEPATRRRRGAFWTALAAVELLLAAVAVLLDLLVPTIIILALAGISLALRREGLATLGFMRSPHPWRMAAVVPSLVVAWQLLQQGLVMPIRNHLTGTTQDLSQFADLQGNLGRLAGFLLLTWTLAAFGEELVYRGTSRPGSPTSSGRTSSGSSSPLASPRCYSGSPTPSRASSAWW